MVQSFQVCSKQLGKPLRSRNVDKDMINEYSQCGIEVTKIPINSLTTKLVCKLCISHKFLPLASKKFVSTKFNINDQKPKSSVYFLIASARLDTKIRMFQYKILDNI